jgi:hypothetical protein
MIKNLFNDLSRSLDVAAMANSIIERTQSDAFFHLNVLKRSRISSVSAALRHGARRKLFLANHLSGFDFRSSELEVDYLEADFFSPLDESAFKARIERIKGGFVILNNNDINSYEKRAGYSRLYEACIDTLFVVWDWDNHHWLEQSTFLATYSDLYVPAHDENLYLLTRFNWITSGPVYCASLQWSKNFLSSRLDQMLKVGRSNSPLGMHVKYEKFAFRNQVVATVRENYPSVGFSDTSYHSVTPESRLVEWCSHKLHWIAPVLNDVPIRIFDSLITGGIPIVPESLRFRFPLRELPLAYVGFYSPIDIVEPGGLVADLVRKFDEQGEAGIIGRHQYAMSHHHAAGAIEKILDYILNLILDVRRE